MLINAVYKEKATTDVLILICYLFFVKPVFLAKITAVFLKSGFCGISVSGNSKTIMRGYFGEECAHLDSLAE